ncbi:metallo-beta-lactamase class B [Novosphingobium sp. CF614]|uniref:subclass B3 metallo-beta-lactamase n=1 Tax=Novosphingobium sp. CF614 TaxID=1884364 RepID=UPI0008E1E183|nr:subclass B3 metallo-beta-lactamase [Novosphingobium sp. CF614]SFG39559.1 metallo-beta-lactamase class B [Novosphingobium sp. CF614]
MTRIFRTMFLAALLTAGPTAADTTPPPAPTAAPTPAPAAAPPSSRQLAEACAGHDGWSDPAPPAQIFGNTWYVGTCGITAILITGDDGHVLIDGGPAEAAGLVLDNIRKLGFRPEDVRWIVSSHEHFDHVGALAALRRATGAKVAALVPAAAVLRSGQPDPADPQYGSIHGFEPTVVDRVLAEGNSLVVGRIAITVHATPVHAPGSTSWTWQSCTPDFSCRMIAYADSASTISADAYRFSDHRDRIAQVRLGLVRIGALPCDLLLTPHPAASDMMDRFAGKAPLVNASACRDYAEAARQRFAARLDLEATEPRP